MRSHLLLWATSVALLGGLGQSRTARAQSVAKIDPCKLVTKDEIQAAIEGKRNPSELARLKQKGIAWSISTQNVTQGDMQRCNIHWQGNLGSVIQETGDMAVIVFDAQMFTATVGDLNRVRRRSGKPDLAPLPGIGDEAHFFGYSEKGNPEARVGAVAVGVETLAGKPSVDLLRAAVARVRPR